MFPLAVSAACVATDVPPTAPPTSRTATASRLVLISLDGLAAVRHRENLAGGVYSDADGLTAFERTGYVVERAIPVDPPLTSPSHAAIATGAFPAVTGIVANWFHVPGTPIDQGVSGFAHPWAAESLWQAFHRQGKRVGVLAYPGCDDTVPSRTADFGMVYVNRPSAPAALLTLSAGQFEPTTVPAGWSSYSPPRRTTTSVVLETAGARTTVTFTLTAIDTTDDRTIDYDTLIADDDSDLGNGALGRARVGQWFPLLVHRPHPDGGTRAVGAWCLLQLMAPDLSTVNVYRGAFFSTEAYPRAFRERLDESAGFWPGPGDERAMAQARAGRAGLSISEFMEQERRFSEFFNACGRTAIATERFDLLLAYQPTVDEVEHVLLVVDPRQPAYSKSFAAIARDAITEAYRIADHAVGELARELDFGHDALVVVSDHGMAPVWETVSVNQILQQAGLAEGELTARGWGVKTTSKIVAFGSGGCLNLYVNLKGREPSGVVDPEDEARVVQSAAVALAAAQVDGEDVVEAMYLHNQLAAVGDLVVFLRPGFMGTATIGAAGTPFHAPAELAGQHGFANTHREMAAIWLARGTGVTKRHTATASLTGVAAFVAHLTGVQPPGEAHPWTP
jgi:predicted AlkP superfamily phosphohydrolase/phosphomutase